MALNSVSGHEGEALNFIISCMEGLNSEADNPDLIKIHVEYMKVFIDSFEQAEIAPVLNRAQTVYNSTPRSIDITAVKKQHNDEVANGTRTINEIVLTAWPKCFKNPILIKKLFGSVPQAKKSGKSISAMTDSKLTAKINNCSGDKDALYLVRYFVKFYMPKDDPMKNYYQHYDKFMDKCKELGYVAKSRNNCFQVKTQDDIARDIIGMFLYEDMTDKDNLTFISNCFDRYDELFG